MRSSRIASSAILHNVLGMRLGENCEASGRKPRFVQRSIWLHALTNASTFSLASAASAPLPVSSRPNRRSSRRPSGFPAGSSNSAMKRHRRAANPVWLRRPRLKRRPLPQHASSPTTPKARAGSLTLPPTGGSARPRRRMTRHRRRQAQRRP